MIRPKAGHLFVSERMSEYDIDGDARRYSGRLRNLIQPKRWVWPAMIRQTPILRLTVIMCFVRLCRSRSLAPRRSSTCARTSVQPNSPSQTISIPNSTQLVVVTCDKSSMGDMLKLIRWAVIGPFRSRVSLEAKFSFSPNATRRLLRKLLRHQGFKDRIEGSAKGDHRQSQGGRRQSAWRC
jgi:hypothetical protein